MNIAPHLLVIDAAERQQIINSRAEGMLLLRAGVKAGRTTEQLWAIRKNVEQCNAKLGTSRFKGQTIGVTITGVTPMGY